MLKILQITNVIHCPHELLASILFRCGDANEAKKSQKYLHHAVGASRTLQCDGGGMRQMLQLEDK